MRYELTDFERAAIRSPALTTEQSRECAGILRHCPSRVRRGIQSARIILAHAVR
jgi:hypothetical protein